MAEIDVSLDDDIAHLLERGDLKETEAIQLQTLRETQSVVNELRKKKQPAPDPSALRFNVTPRQR